MINRGKTFTAQRLPGLVVLAILSVNVGSPALAQTAALMEACNSISDKTKRLGCFKEIEQLKGAAAGTSVGSVTGASAGLGGAPRAGASDAGALAASKQASSIAAVKSSFAAIGGAVRSGISYANYRALVLEPAKAVGIFRQESPNAGSSTLESLDRAVMAYNDAARLWNASIYKTKDAGIFGRILNYEDEGLSDIVFKYNLTTTKILSTPHISVNGALPEIWRYAELAVKNAFENEPVQTQIAEKTKTPTEIVDGRGNEAVNLNAGMLGAPPGQLIPKFGWPVVGEIITGFDGDKNRGLDIDGKAGDPVFAAGDGVVVFSSSKLNGYGNLIIIKHDNTYLTAYAHNDTLLAREGQKVTKGQTVATMGSSESDRVKLHFEIRRNGTAIDPTPYLPENLQSARQPPSPQVESAK